MSTMNPFKMIRRRLRLSTHGVGGLGQGTVRRIEDGHYEGLSDGMIDALVAEVTAKGVDFERIAADLEKVYGTPYLSEAYTRWRKTHRQESGDLVQAPGTGSWPSLDRIRDVSEKFGSSPMGAFTREVSGTVNQFCRDFCVQGPTLARYIEGRYDYLTPPEAIRQALVDARYPQIEELFELQRKWLDERA